MKLTKRTEIFFGDEHFEWGAYPWLKWLYYEDYKELYLGIFPIAFIKIVQKRK